MCYCVNMEGAEMSNSNHGQGEEHNCNFRRAMAMSEDCYQKQEMAEDNMEVNCTSDGLYSPVQCGDSGCSCVDEYGAEFGEKFDQGAAETCEADRDERALTYKCLGERKNAYMMSSTGLSGAFTPVCDDMGDYAPVQCEGSECYCVDPMGRKMSEETFGRGQEDNCEDERTEMMQQECYQEYLKSVNDDSEMMFGSFIPNCNPRGYYAVDQCKGMECYCADEMGRQISDTNYVRGEESDCETKVSEIMSSECNAARKEGMDKAELGMVGNFVPECLVDGSYEAKQCEGSSCYCSDRSGRELSNSRHDIGSDDQDCEMRREKLESSACYIQSQEAADFLGGFVPMCDEEGNYEARQCEGSECYCVDTAGDKIEGTENDISEESPCEEVRLVMESSACFMEQKSVDEMPGAFYPNCSLTDGSYSPRQCQGSECYCVIESGEKINGTEHTREDEDPCVEEDGNRVQSCSQVQEAMLQLSGNEGPMPGLPTVFCTEDGQYFAQQCVGTACKCVDGYNRKVENSEHHVADQSKCMMMLNQGGRMLTAPKKECDDVRTNAQSSGFVGGYVPECVNSEYHPRQCFGSVCFCVNENGEEKEDSEHPINEQRDCFDPIFHMRVPEMIEVGEGSSVTCAITASQDDETFVMVINDVRYDELEGVWADADFKRNTYLEDNGTVITAIEGFVETYVMEQNGTRVQCISEKHSLSETRELMLNGTAGKFMNSLLITIRCFFTFQV